MSTEVKSSHESGQRLELQRAESGTAPAFPQAIEPGNVDLRIPAEGDVDGSPLAALSEIEHKAAFFAAHGMSYADIGKKLNIASSTVSGYLREAYSKLGIDRKSQLPSVLPFDDRYLEGLELGSLSSREFEVFELAAYGLNNAQAASRLYLGESTIRTHQRNMRTKLGLRNIVELSQIACLYGQKNIDAAYSVRDQTVEKLTNLQTLEQEGKIDLSQRIVRKIQDSGLLQVLRGEGYINPHMYDAGEVGLHGLVAALLMRKAKTKAHLLDPHTKDISRDVIFQEVKVFVDNRRATAQ